MTHIAIEIPEDIANRLLTEGNDLPRLTLEALAVEGYRSRRLTKGEVRRLLNFSWHETEAFLKERQAYLDYTEEDFDQDMATMKQLLSKCLLFPILHRSII